MLTALLLFTSAHAGKLAEGFRGVPFGPDTLLTAPPDPGCFPATTAGVRWGCIYTIGGVEVVAVYLVDAGFFYGVVLRPREDEYATAIGLRRVLDAAYGACTPLGGATGQPGNCAWRDGTVIGGWDYNQFSHRASFTAFDTELSNLVEARKAADAAKAVDGL